MERVQRLMDLWGYLPAFRAVAETQHLPSAAERVGVSPSALSRAVTALETRVGKRLFRRQGGRLVLDDAGTELLQRLRDAMRLVDDGVDAARGEELAGPLRVASTSQLGTTLLVPALLALREPFPRLRPELANPPESPEDELRQGRLDLVLTEEPPETRSLRLVPLGSFANAVYCGPGHPLHANPRVTLAELRQHGFVAPPARAGRPLDDWPPELPRRVDLRVLQMLTALQACASGAALAVLPERVVLLHDPAGRLRRVQVSGLRLPATGLYALSRAPLGKQDRAGAVLRFLQEQSAAPPQPAASPKQRPARRPRR